LQFEITLIEAPIPEVVGEGGSMIGSGIEFLNLYRVVWSKGSEQEVASEKDLL